MLIPIFYLVLLALLFVGATFDNKHVEATSLTGMVTVAIYYVFTFWKQVPGKKVGGSNSPFNGDYSPNLDSTSLENLHIDGSHSVDLGGHSDFSSNFERLSCV